MWVQCALVILALCSAGALGSPHRADTMMLTDRGLGKSLPNGHVLNQCPP